ncbi:MAG: sodium:solute symporter family protein [Maricaulaceae bacterium]|nr:sodium:solute symporter family protein [Maricaulaceae bacterium]
MNLLLFALLGYVALQIGVAYWASRRTGDDVDYLVAGRRLGLFAVALSVFATWFGGETVIGSSAIIAEEGLAGARAEPFGYAICLLLMAFLIAAQFRKRGYITLADFFRDRFGPKAEAAAALVSIPTSVIWAAAQLLALATILSVIAGIDVGVTLVAATVLVIGYTMLGGLLASVMTDVLQGAVLFIGLVILLVLMIGSAGGVGPALAAIDPVRLTLLPEGESWIARLDVWMIPILGSIVAQEPIARFLGAKSPKTARNGGVLAAGLYLMVGFIPLAFGLIGPAIGLHAGEGDLFLPVLAQSLMPPVLFVVFAGALFSAVLSTVDSAILAASGLATENLYVRARPKADAKEKLLAARVFTALAGLAALFVATSGETIYGLVEIASSLGSAGLLVSVLIGLNSRLGGEASVLAAILSGLATILIAGWIYDIPGAFMLSIACAAGGYLLAPPLARRAAQGARR